jgi:hypothetical protein
MKKAASKEAAKSAIKEVQQSLTELTLTKIVFKDRHEKGSACQALPRVQIFDSL